MVVMAAAAVVVVGVDGCFIASYITTDENIYIYKFNSWKYVNNSVDHRTFAIICTQKSGNHFRIFFTICKQHIYILAQP